MISPKPKKRPWHGKKKERPRPQKKEEPTHPFYSRALWRTNRQSYINNWIQTIRDQVPQGYITIKSERYELEPYQQTKILSMNQPCEKCIQMYCFDDTRNISEGRELDHINPVNPDNPLDDQGKWGDPMDWNNLQLLCHTHHSRKTQHRDNKITKLRKND
jgi:hypothetical protein